MDLRSSFVRMFRAIMGCLQFLHLTHHDSSNIHSNPLCQEDTTSTHTLDPKIIHSGPSSRQVYYKNDVFISFRGSDTRNNFTDHLYNNLIRKGISTFKDDKKLEKGEPISPQLLQAIRDSRVAIIVFSKHYADSKWCLEEMAAIADCHQELKQVVLSVFYDMDPSHVRNQNGVYKDAFALHTNQNTDKVDRWKRAMTSLAYSVGWDIRDKPEFAEIENIIQKVKRSLKHKLSVSDDDLVGIKDRVDEIEKLLRLSYGDDDFQVLGIWGMSGIGKTTLATVLCNKISYQFDACCFIDDVSKKHEDGGAISVKREILGQTLGDPNLDTCSFLDISEKMRNELSHMKVLIVLDNVDKQEQMDIIPKLLKKGSRVIVTTRDEHILNAYGADTIIYEVPLLNNKDARDLFLRKAFKEGNTPDISFEQLIPKILKYAQNLPLAIKVLGSYLCNRDAMYWRNELEKLRNNPNQTIINVLRISLGGLDHQQREIFLHIACFFKGEREEYVKQILWSCGLEAHNGIQGIREKSLIIIRNQEIHMHDMLRELGKEIVREKYPEDPTSWTRVWLYKDFENVLMSGKGTDNVKAIVLNQNENILQDSPLEMEGLSKMRSLLLLILYQKNVSGSLNSLSYNLQYLLWHSYPFSSLPSFKRFSGLVELNLPDSSIKRLWEGCESFPHLERVNLSNSKDLTETPNFQRSPNLKRLDLSGCTSLSKVHSSIGLLTKLAYLSLQDCTSLVSLNLGIECKLSSLRVLHLSGCTQLEATPDFTGVSSLEYLDLEKCTRLFTIQESIGDLVALKFLSFRDCINISKMVNIQNMRSLQTLDLSGCIKLMSLSLSLGWPITPNSLKYLCSLILMDLRFCPLRELPREIGKLTCLERLNLQGSKIESLPCTIENLPRLAYLNLSHCSKLWLLPRLPSKSDSSGGKYFKTLSTSRNHRSGLYIFDSPIKMEGDFLKMALSWLTRLVEQPCHFRCGFDIVIPISGCEIPEWYFNHQFEGGSTIRIVDPHMYDYCTGFAFCAVFEVKRGNDSPSTSSQQPHPLYLSFESEHAEEIFDMPPSLHMESEHDGSSLRYCWMIYISKEHCHFVQTGACITFKARRGIEVKKWGLRMVVKQNTEVMRKKGDEHLWRFGNEGDDADPYFYRGETSRPWCKSYSLLPVYRLVIEEVHGSSSNSEPKIQLPYNWLVNDEAENEIREAKNKENNISNTGLSSGQLE